MTECLIFDFDDTLSDFQLAKERAKEKITPYLREDGIDTGDYWDYYESIFETVFARYISHELTVEEYRLMRFEHHGVSRERAAFYNEIYLATVNQAILFDDVLPCFRELKRRGYRIAALTNGPVSQRKKIEACEAGSYFDRIFISAEIGAGKPDPACYHYVLNELGLTADQALMIGDNYVNDCRAAEEVGIRSVQVVRHQREPQQERFIKSLYELTEGEL